MKVPKFHCSQDWTPKKAVVSADEGEAEQPNWGELWFHGQVAEQPSTVERVGWLMNIGVSA